MARKPATLTANLSDGFTIVETLIVLAVASLILMIVMMAIPALERSSHNNSRRQDVQAILGAVSRYKLNNSGSMPGSASNFLKYTRLVSYTKSVVYISGGIGTPTNDGINVYSELPTTTPATETDNTLDRVDVHNYRKCSSSQQGSSTNKGAGFGDVAALYAIETGSAVEPQCQEL